MGREGFISVFYFMVNDSSTTCWLLHVAYMVLKRYLHTENSAGMTVQLVLEYDFGNSSHAER